MTLPTAALLVALAIPGAAAAQSMLDRTLPSQPPLKLDTPSSPERAIQIIEEVLRLMRVPFGLEALPPSADPPDFATSASSEATILNGLTVRAALETVLRQARQYDWEERNGRVIVRPAATGADDFLRSTIAFSVTGASPREALDALVKAIPIRGGRWQVGGFGMSTQLTIEGGETPSPSAPRQERRITMSMTGAVRDVLDAISTAYGPMSWSVRYRAPDARAENATIALTTEGAAVLATRADPGRSRLMLPVTGNIDTALGAYAVRARVRINFEQLPGPVAETQSGHAPLDVTGLGVEAALSRILMLDSRYEWTKSADAFLVRPRPDLARRTALDQTVPAFSASDEPVEAVLVRIAGLLGRVSGRGGGGSGDWEKAAAKTHVTFSAAAGPVRDLLSALAAAANMSWNVTFIPQPNDTTTIQLSLQGPDFSLMRSVKLRADEK